MKTRSKSIFIVFFVLVLILSVNLACGLPSLAKPTETPTFTSTSTFTPLPTSTNTPKPTATATPNLQATQVAEMEQAVMDVLTRFDLPTDTGSLAWVQDGKTEIELESSSWIFEQFAEDVVASDFVISSDMTWDTDSWPVCGIWFRSDDRWGLGDQYMLQFLRISGFPAWDIEYYKNGDFTSNITEKLRFSSYLNLESGATNQFILAAIGNQFKVYINGTFEGRYYDYSSKLSEGQFAFSASQDSGVTTCTFENTWIWLYK